MVCGVPKHMRKKTSKCMPKRFKRTLAIPFTDAVWCGMRCAQVDCQQRQQIGVSSLEPSYINLLKKLSTQEISHSPHNGFSKSSSSLSMQQRRRCDIRHYVMLVIRSHLSPTRCTLTINFFSTPCFIKRI